MFSGPADAFTLLNLPPEAVALRLVLFAIVAIVLPGAGLLRAIGNREGGLVLPVGVTACSALSGLALWTRQPWLFPLGILSAALLDPTRLRTHRFRLDRAAVAPALALACLITATSPAGNRLSEGSFAFQFDGMHDNAYHVGVAFELAGGDVPEVPGLAGVTLRYHFGQDLVRAAAFRFGGIHPYDSLTRFEPILGGLALVLAFPVVARAMGLPPLAVFLCPWLVLASDASFLLAPWIRSGDWADRTRMNFVMQILLGNAGSPLALSSALGTIALLSEPPTRGRTWLASFLAAMTALFKVFVGAQLAAGLLLAGVLRRRTRPWLAPILPLACAMTALSWSATGGTEIAWAPLTQAKIFGASLGVPSLWMSVALWAVIGLGARCVGVYRLATSLASDSPACAAVAGATLSGLLAGSGFVVQLRQALHSETVYNEGAYFLEQGGLLMWFFVAWQVATWPRTRAVVIGVLLVSFPATLKTLLCFRAQPVVSEPKEVIRAMATLALVAAPGDVVVTRLRGGRPPLPVVLLGLRVPVSNFFGYLTRYEAIERVEKKETLIRTLLSTNDPEEARSALAGLRASFVLLVEDRELLFPTPGVLEPLLRESGVSLYTTRR